MTFVMLTGGIDLSVGSIIGLVGVLCGMMMVKGGLNPWVAAILSIAIGTAMGFINAFIINRFSVPPLIATLGMMTTWRGVAFMITNGLPVYGFPEVFTNLGQGYIWIVPIPVVVMAICFAVGWVVLNKFTIGRYVYGIGGNEEASRLSGINVKKVKYLVYTLAGFLFGIAGVMLLSRTNSGPPKAGTGAEMDIITAVVLGGISIKGGEGKLTGVIAGMLIMGVLTNGMIITNVGDYVQRVVAGMVLIVAVAFDIYNQKRRDTRLERQNTINADVQ
jgi:ribose transport system permease protein